MGTSIKLPQKGAVARVTEERKKLRHQPASSDLREIFKKEKDTAPTAPEKKIAKSKKRDPDLDL